jgi:glycosyltransferase involved in cell wall biosynthesis
MEITGIKYMAPFLDGSGYAEAARQYVVALHKMGIPLTLENISFEEARPNLGKNGQIIHDLMGKNVPYNIKIIQLTAEHYPLYKEEGVFNIGYSFWETSKICDRWVDYINKNLQMCFVSCQWNLEAYRDSGVTIPIRRILQGIDMGEFENASRFEIAGADKDDYLFYSIFQWTERKHPMALLKAYWNAFQNDEKVALVLKTYRSNFSEGEKQAIRGTILRLKQVMPMKHYPKVLLIPDMLSRKEILALHNRCDCFILLQRGEGWGLPHFEAGAFGKPVITTNYSSVLEFLKPENSYLVDYSLTPVFGMPWCPWYEGDQWWAEPDVHHAMEIMQHVYNNREEARVKGALLKDFITINFPWDKVSVDMVKFIQEV